MNAWISEADAARKVKPLRENSRNSCKRAGCAEVTNKAVGVNWTFPMKIAICAQIELVRICNMLRRVIRPIQQTLQPPEPRIQIRKVRQPFIHQALELVGQHLHAGQAVRCRARP